jgi:integrase/recombinase XerD
VEPDEGFLFLNNDGKQLGLGYLGDRVRADVKAADIGKRGACHIFRHTMASLMLANGCDVRFIQEMLGHADLSSIQVYTQVTITKLKEMHTATHPAARLARRSEQQDGDGADQAELLAQLDVEADEDEDPEG